jgi:replicative DNA helicase
MFIYRPEADTSLPLVPVKLLIAKHRNGATGDVDLLFQGNRIRFSSIERHHDDNQASASA